MPLLNILWKSKTVCNSIPAETYLRGGKFRPISRNFCLQKKKLFYFCISQNFREIAQCGKSTVEIPYLRRHIGEEESFVTKFLIKSMIARRSQMSSVKTTMLNELKS